MDTDRSNSQLSPVLELRQLLADWEQGVSSREEIVKALSAVQTGDTIKGLITELATVDKKTLLTNEQNASGAENATERWRSELMTCRAKAWSFPEASGMLVGENILILMDGQSGVLLSAEGHTPLPSSSAASLMLLCQTIVMAQSAVNAQELQQLTRERLTSSSTSLSEIKTIK